MPLCLKQLPERAEALYSSREALSRRPGRCIAAVTTRPAGAHASSPRRNSAPASGAARLSASRERTGTRRQQGHSPLRPFVDGVAVCAHSSGCGMEASGEPSSANPAILIAQKDCAAAVRWKSEMN